ncbi:hypothetical protein N7491_005175 [Penicillium cf. griseofulvum]|uniref:Uncharacterized protein n=1 Tax=Penicillium cf. griseofulvum TaxID=2972120 RepID=A0A9W9J303_9EURO|nr:hypothetical protein N7472_007868 [Penicillium cf. griseofulvum]KAJ5434580.1 hypothetical protein N7491_005175 [Penicillium cf. griseofulvum]
MSTTTTPSAEAYLPAFNNQVNSKKAYTWSLIQIKAFMIEVVHNPSTYVVERNVVSELKRLRTDILDLGEIGSRYLSETSCPQSISRIINPAANEDESYFLLNKMTYGGRPYWCTFDLLGRFLSLISPAPQGATQNNFYLPLTLPYANWCGKIAPTAPWVHSCVWAEEKDELSGFHLGASLAGYRNLAGQGSRWVKVLQQARFNLLRDERLDAAGITIDSTRLRGRTRNALTFGNCAETYPLVYLLRNRDPKKEIYGLAVMRKNLPQDAYGHAEALNALTTPCVNCQRIITTWGGKVENFITDDILEISTGLPSEVQGPAAPCPNPRASKSKITLLTRAKRPAPADDTVEPAAKKAKGQVPVIPRKPSHLTGGKNK